MSIEQALADNTAAIREMIGVLKIMNTPIVQVTPTSLDLGAEEAIANPETKAPAKRSNKKAAAPEPSAPAPALGATSAAATEAVAPAIKPVTYAELQTAVLALIAKKGKGAVEVILAANGLKTFKQAEPEHYGMLLAQVKAAL